MYSTCLLDTKVATPLIRWINLCARLMPTIFLWAGIFYVVTSEYTNVKSCYGSNSMTSRKEKFHSINRYMHRKRIVVWTQRNGTHSEVANKTKYPMITGANLKECINMKVMKTRKDYRDNWKISILKEHFFQSPWTILLFNQTSFASTIYTDIVSPFDFNKSSEKNSKFVYV